MKKKFSDYATMRRDHELAKALIDLGVDTQQWVENIIFIHKQYELSQGELQEAIMGGLGGLGRAALSGVGNAIDVAGQSVMPMLHAAHSAWKSGSIKQDFDNAIKGVGKLKNYLTQVQGPQQANQFINKFTQQLNDIHKQISSNNSYNNSSNKSSNPYTYQSNTQQNQNGPQQKNNNSYTHQANTQQVPTQQNSGSQNTKSPTNPQPGVFQMTT